jgi:hypothetical protein
MGDGSVKGVLSVTISNWTTPGLCGAPFHPARLLGITLRWQVRLHENRDGVLQRRSFG